MNTSFAVIFIALYTAHMVGDHWLQTDHQARGKANPGWRGRGICATHVGIYTLTCLVAVLAVAGQTITTLDPTTLTAGLTLTAGTHYLADRRVPLDRLASLVGCGGFWHRSPYQLDQSWHIG